jgi:hypothetical protein
VHKWVEKDVTKTVYDRVPCTETRTVMKKHWTTQTVTEMRSKRVDRGHWECREVDAPFQNMLQNLHHACKRNDCNDCCESSRPCPKTRTVKRWCSNWVTECCPVTVCKRVCVERPETCTVTTYKCVPRQVTCRVKCCVAERCMKTETYTCNVHKQVPYQCTKQVWECVPFQETVTCTRYVRKAVTQPAPAPAPAPVAQPCDNACAPSCCDSRGHRFGNFFGGMRDRFSHFGNRGCGCGAETSCGGGCH